MRGHKTAVANARHIHVFLVGCLCQLICNRIQPSDHSKVAHHHNLRCIFNRGFVWTWSVWSWNRYRCKSCGNQVFYDCLHNSMSFERKSWGGATVRAAVRAAVRTVTCRKSNKEPKQSDARKNWGSLHRCLKICRPALSREKHLEAVWTIETSGFEQRSWLGQNTQKRALRLQKQ